MDSIRATVQRNDRKKLVGALTTNTFNISGKLTTNNLSMSARLGAVRVYPIVPTQEKTAISSLVRQEVTPDGNNKLSKVIIEPLPVSRVLNEKGGYTVIIGGN